MNYSHLGFQALIQKAKYEEAQKYHEEAIPPPDSDSDTDFVVYLLDQSYLHRRNKLFRQAIKTIDKAIVQIDKKLDKFASDNLDIKQLPWRIWKYVALVNRAKCLLKFNKFEAVESYLQPLRLLAEDVLPNRLATPSVSRLEEVWIELNLRKAQHAEGEEKKKEYFMQASQHAQILLECVLHQQKTHWLGRCYEISGDIELKLGNKEQAKTNFDKAVKEYENQFTGNHRYTQRARIKHTNLL